MTQTRLFITGIGTGVGKTIASAVLVEALKASYWKPIQAGDLDNSDTKVVASLCPGLAQAFPERHALTQPLSPHAAAKIDGISIKLEDFSCPNCDGTLIIEGAGGLLVPLSDTLTIADLIEHLRAQVVVVSRHYLGSINHTLLTISELTRRRLPIAGLLFVGDENQTTESVISGHPLIKQCPVPILGRIPTASTINRDFIAQQAQACSKNFRVLYSS
jgi:dethiobiotin synthetase